MNILHVKWVLQKHVSRICKHDFITTSFAPTMYAQSNVVVLPRPSYRTNVISPSCTAYAPFFSSSTLCFLYLFYQTNLYYTNLFLYFHFSFFYLFLSQARRAQAYSRASSYFFVIIIIVHILA